MDSPRREATTALLANVLDPETLAKVYPDIPKLLEFALSCVPGICRCSAIPGADGRHALSEHAGSPTERCRGAVTSRPGCPVPTGRAGEPALGLGQ